MNIYYNGRYLSDTETIRSFFMEKEKVGGKVLDFDKEPSISEARQKSDWPEMLRLFNKNGE